MINLKNRIKQIPSDFKNPEWNEKYRVHNWRNYVTDEVKNEWGNFTKKQKKILSDNFQGIADTEDWC